VRLLGALAVNDGNRVRLDVVQTNFVTLASVLGFGENLQVGWCMQTTYVFSVEGDYVVHLKAREQLAEEVETFDLCLFCWTSCNWASC